MGMAVLAGVLGLGALPPQRVQSRLVTLRSSRTSIRVAVSVLTVLAWVVMSALVAASRRGDVLPRLIRQIERRHGVVIESSSRSSIVGFATRRMQSSQSR
jgi:hypothetical protein